MVISSSYGATKIYKFSSVHFAYKHFVFAIGALVLMNLISKQEKYMQKIGHFIWFLTVFFLICVLVFGHSAKGAKRWIYIFGFNFQPSEFVKIGIVLQSSYFLYTNLYFYFLTYAIPMFFILLQPDIGTAVLLLCLGAAQLFSNQKQLNWKILITSIFSIMLLIVLAYFSFSHVQERINMFLNPNTDIFGIGYQKHKAFLTIANGGFFGKGFGKGVIKDLLPDAHTDYIFAVIIEEFGLLGGVFVLTLFVLLGLRCRVLTAKNEYFGTVQYSALLLILGQAWMNIASTLAIIPSKGITLPLISYGGSGIITQGILFGILVATSRKKQAKGLVDL